jgi:hypothetical protein
MFTSHCNRLGAVHAERAAICKRLAGASAQQPVAAATAAASADEVVASLEDNLRTDGFIRVATNLTLVAVAMPVPFARVRRGRGGVGAGSGGTRHRGLPTHGLMQRRPPSSFLFSSRSWWLLLTPIQVRRPTP